MCDGRHDDHRVRLRGPKVSLADVKALGPWRKVIPNNVKDYVPLNAFM